MTRKCEVCGCEIPQERLDIIPETTVCVNCTAEEKVEGLMVFTHKTAPSIVIFHPGEKEAIRRAKRFSTRARK